MHLLIVTQGGKLLPTIEKLIKTMDLQKDVQIITNIPNIHMPSIYSAAYATISSSYKEIFGMNILESLACGTPVITTPTAGAIEIVKNKQNGLITQDFSTKNLQQSISELLSDEQLYLKIKKNTRKSVENKYNIESISNKWFKSIERLKNNF